MIERRGVSMRWSMAGMIIVMLLSGCAARPHKIEAEYVSELNYDRRSCDELRDEQFRLVEALNHAARSQKTARRWDIVAVVAIGLPVSSLSGMNRASEIARLKGEWAAVLSVAQRKSCDLQVLPDPTLKPRRRFFATDDASPPHAESAPEASDQ